MEKNICEVNVERLRFERELYELGLQTIASPVPFFSEKAGPKVRLEHFHVRKYYDPGIRALMPESSAGVMTPARMYPDYLLPTDPARQALQRAVVSLVTTTYSSALAPNKHLKLAIADLTGVKHHKPVFAGYEAWGPGSEMDGASLPKVLALYALYQLRFDLNTFAELNTIEKASDLRSAIKKEWAKKGMKAFPDLLSLFKFVEKAGDAVKVKLKTTHDVHHNWVARQLIVSIGFEYIGSVALQSGLFDEAQGGMWLNAAYNKPAVTWDSSPFPNVFRHNLTALATVSFFTMLAQGRLVDQATSFEIRDALAKKVVSGVVSTRECMNSGLITGIKQLGGLQHPAANKCGIGDGTPLYHEGVHIVRQVSAGKRIAYTMGLLTKEPPKLDFTKLGKELDALIVAANP